MRKATVIAVGLIVLIFIVLAAGTTFFTDWLWFKSLGFTGVFWTSFLTNWVVRLTAFAVTFAFLFVNFALALRAFKRLRPPEEGLLTQLQQLGDLPLPWLNLAASAVLAFLISSALNPGWAAVQQFLHPVTVGIADPVLKLDVGYYLFRFPILQSLNGLAQSLAWLTLLGVGAVYWMSQAFWRQGNTYVLWPQAKTHLTVLAALLFLAKIWGYTLARQGLLLKDTGLLTGVDFTANVIRLPVYNLLALIAAACIVLLIVSLFRRGLRLFLAGVILLFGSSFVLGGLAPGLVQAIRVKPNEYSLEKKYLARHIEFTRKAYGLDRVVVQDFPFGKGGGETLSPNNPTLANLRLWDFRVLKSSYDQLQVLRPYYVFNDVDIDRYTINGRERQVMLSARELDTAQLPQQGKSWVNLHLSYTHGYGAVLNAVSEVNQEGQPVFLVGDIPPKVATGVDLPPFVRPQVYFGETQDSYVVAPSTTDEFDYPTEAGEKYTNYRGRDGVSLASFWSRLLFALRFGDLNLLLSTDIKPNSKILFYRQVTERVQKLAPFLAYDADPYLVLAEGRLFWIIDAYTHSSTYPYAARHGATGINYIRNSVKVVVDAYEGTTRFYVADPTDPIIRIWQHIFPQLFFALDTMPAGLRTHLRYPEDLFAMQRDMLLLYHMTDSRSFYRKEDAWAVPTETHGGNVEEDLIPYYVIVRLPGQAQPEFVMMQPLKPSAPKQKNMIAWLAARCDGANYGQVLLYQLPRDRIIYGPIQVQGRIAQNSEISKLHTLWGQQQSTLERGNLLVLPFAGDFLYVEPEFIISNQGQQPELKLVVLAYKDRIVYGSTLPEALAQLTGMAPPGTPGTTAPGPTQARPTSPTRDEMVRLLQQLEDSIRAQQEAIRRQQQLLSDLRERIGR